MSELRKDHVAGQLSKLNIDAGESGFVAAALEQVRATPIETMYGKLKAKDFLPVNTSVSPGAETWAYDTYTSFGSAELAASYATQSPRAETSASREVARLYSVRASYAYNVQELRAAALAQANGMAGADLLARKAAAAADAIARKLDDAALLGEGTPANLMVTGLFKLSNTNTSYTLSTGVGGTAFVNKTGDEILGDLMGIAHGIISNSKENYSPNAMILPLTTMNFLTRKRMGDANNLSVLEYFKQMSGITDVRASTKLETAGSGNATRMVCYQKSAEVLEWLLPIAFEQFQPQVNAMEFVTECHARTGGVIAYHPKAIAYLDGI